MPHYRSPVVQQCGDRANYKADGAIQVRSWRRRSPGASKAAPTLPLFRLEVGRVGGIDRSALAARDAQRLPVRAFPVFGQKNDLSGVKRKVSDGPVDGL